MTAPPPDLHTRTQALAEQLRARAPEESSWAKHLSTIEELLLLTSEKRIASSVSHQQLIHFGKLLRDKRNAAGLSRIQLARKAKLSDATVKFVETARHPASRATLIRLIGVPELKLSWAEVPGHDPPTTVRPSFDEMPAKACDLNWFVAPGYDPIRLVTDLGRLLGGAGGHLEQTNLYLDPQSAAAYLAVCRHPGAAILRASAPLAEAARHIAGACGSSGLRVIALGAGDATLETQLVQHLLQTTAVPSLDLCLLDISQPLLATGFQQATDALSGRTGVSVWGMQANFHSLGEYPQLRRSPQHRHLFCLLGGTLANLDHEPRFFRHSLGGEPGDLLLVDLQVACGSPKNPEDIKKRDQTWSGGVSPLLAAWLGGPIWRHCKDVTHVEFRWELDIQSPIPGSYALEAMATVQSQSRAAREFSMYRFRRYEGTGLTHCLHELGWQELAALPYGPRDQPASLRLFVARA